MEIRDFVIETAEGRMDVAQMSLEEAIGTVIRSLNPYTKGKKNTMTLGLPVEISISTAGTDTEPKVEVKNVPVEIDDYHDGRAEWIFKAQPHRVQRALRIQYRHKMDGEG